MNLFKISIIKYNRSDCNEVHILINDNQSISMFLNQPMQRSEIFKKQVQYIYYIIYLYIFFQKYNISIELNINKMQFFKKTVNTYLKSLNILKSNTEQCEIIWSPQMIQVFNINNLEGRKNTDEIFKILNNEKTHPIVRLKILMLLYTIIINSNNHYKYFEQKQIKNFSIQKKKIGITQNSKQWLSQIILIFSKFIQKICSNSNLYQDLKCNKGQENNVNQLIQKVYLTINLLNVISPLKDYILNFGRYSLNQYQIIVSLNKLITQDLYIIYKGYSNILQILKNQYPLHQMNKQQLGLYSNIIDETFLIHESLYLFFYNRYFYNKINLGSINWFRFDNNDYEKLKQTKQSKQRKKIKLDCANFDIGSFQKSYFSAQDNSHEINFSEF